MQNSYPIYTVEFAPSYHTKYALNIPARRLSNDTVTNILRRSINKNLYIDEIIKRSFKRFNVLINIPKHIASKTCCFASNRPYAIVTVHQNGLNPLARERMICHQATENRLEKVILDYYIDGEELLRVWRINGYPRRLTLDGNYSKQQMLPVVIISRSAIRVKWIPWKR